MISLFDLLKKYNGFIFDLIQFALGSVVFYLLGLRLQANIDIVNGEVSAVGDPVSIMVLILTVLAQPVGAIFLKDAVQNSLADNSRKSTGPTGFIFLLFVVIMYLVFLAMMVMDIYKNLGLDYNTIFEESSSIVDFLLGLFLFVSCMIPTALTCLILIPSKKEFIVTPFAVLKTLAGDFIISFSAFVFVSIFWDNLMSPLASDLSGETFGFKLILVATFFFLFLLIYLPPRLVFLVTDYAKFFTWIRILIVFFPFLLALYN